MAKKTTAFELMLPVRDRRTPAYQWLYAALRSEILEGRLRRGAKLPGTRDLAGQYGLSRGTIVSAFEQLKSEGYVEGSVGSGTYVSRVLPDELLQVARASVAPSRTTGTPPSPLRLRQARASVPDVRGPPDPRIPRQSAGGGPVPHRVVGTDHGSPSATNHRATSDRL